MVAASRRSGPVHSAVTTAAIRDAVVAELDERGYQQLTVEGVARRAVVGKAAIYRRYSSKQELVVETLAFFATEVVADELWMDTGTLRGDVVAFVAGTARYLGNPSIARITADILAVVSRDDSFADALEKRVGSFRRARAVDLVRRAIGRGELSRTCDVELAADLLGAPLYWRLVVRRGSAGKTYRDHVVAAVVAGMSV